MIRGKVESRITPNKGMVIVPSGEFIMGSGHGILNERPAYEVTIDSFCIDILEVTNFDYGKCVKNGRCDKNTDHRGLTGVDQPVVGVGWNQAGRGERLPTEAEWEQAARGIDGRAQPWGEDIDYSMVNYRDCGDDSTLPVGSHPRGANPHGAMDMAGNAREWVATCQYPDYYRDSPAENPIATGDCDYNVLRGASWDYNPWFLRTTYRLRHSASRQLDDSGFRCAVAVELRKGLTDGRASNMPCPS